MCVLLRTSHDDIKGKCTNWHNFVADQKLLIIQKFMKFAGEEKKTVKLSAANGL